MMEPWVTFLPKGAKRWMNANDRLFWMERNRRTQQWRGQARVQVTELGAPHFERAHMVAELLFADRRRRDPANWSPTVKAIVDGLVDAHVLDDDNDDYLSGPDLRIGEPVAGVNVGVRIWLYPRSELVKRVGDVTYVGCDICQAGETPRPGLPTSEYTVHTRSFVMVHRPQCPIVAEKLTVPEES